MSSENVPLAVDSLVKAYPETKDAPPAVQDVSFSIEEGKFYTLLGPSGCGKSTTLRCVAGLEKTDGGTITIAGRTVSSHEPKVFVRPNDRELGMVFQSYAIWPHMSVYQNVAFPLLAMGRRRPIARRDVRARVLECLERVQLASFSDRLASKLSGGQQQRLALARALAREPKLLLLDEPLSNLDASLRELMRDELRRLQRNLGVTTLYVTHDQSEALSLSNRVAVMEAGRIVQEGTPREIYRRPASSFVAAFVGRTNVLDARIVGDGPDDTSQLETSLGRLHAVCPAGVQNHDNVAVSIRPEDVRLHAAAAASSPNSFVGKVEYRLFLGDRFEYHVAVADEILISIQHPDLEFRRGEEIVVELPINRCAVVSEDHGSNSIDLGSEDDDPVVRPEGIATVLAVQP
jgi:iron(III) transport system ATP-binding protein